MRLLTVCNGGVLCVLQSTSLDMSSVYLLFNNNNNTLFKYTKVIFEKVDFEVIPIYTSPL